MVKFIIINSKDYLRPMIPRNVLNPESLVSTLTMVITAERVPDSKNYPPLPDLILDNLPMIPWAFKASEFCVCLEIILVVCILIFHRYRLIVLRRGLSITGSIMLLRWFPIFGFDVLMLYKFSLDLTSCRNHFLPHGP